MKKSSPASTTQKVNGGTVTTTVTPGGGRSIEIKGVSGYHLGQTHVYGTSSSSAFHQPSPSTANKDKKQKQPTSQDTKKSSITVKTGTTFQKVGSLTLSSSQVQAMQNRHPHSVFANERAYQDAKKTTASSDADSSQQTKPSSFKR